MYYMGEIINVSKKVILSILAALYFKQVHEIKKSLYMMVIVFIVSVVFVALILNGYWKQIK